MTTFMLNKYTAEVRTYTFDFSQQDEITVGDTLASLTSVTSTSGVTIGAQTLGTKTIQVELSGGTSGTSYTVTCLVTTAAAATLQSVGILAVS